MNIIISNSSGVPIYEQICSQIKAQIVSGELREGELLPSIRLLAKELRISVITTKRAYEELEREGYIYTLAGKGCYVSAQNQDFYLEEQQKRIEARFAEAIEIARASGIGLDRLVALLKLLYEEDS